MFTAATAGFLLGLSLIVAIGAQNAFILRQGLRRSMCCRSSSPAQSPMRS